VSILAPGFARLCKFVADHSIGSGYIGFRAPASSLLQARVIVLARHEPSEVCVLSPSFASSTRRKRSAERRSGAAAPDGGRMTYARKRLRGASRSTQTSLRRSALAGTLASRRSTAGFWAPVRRGMKQEGFSTCELRSASKTRVNALMRPLVVAEGRFPKPPGVCFAWSKRAGHRIPLCHRNASREHLKRTERGRDKDDRRRVKRAINNPLFIAVDRCAMALGRLQNLCTNFFDGVAGCAGVRRLGDAVMRRHNSNVEMPCVRRTRP